MRTAGARSRREGSLTWTAVRWRARTLTACAGIVSVLILLVAPGPAAQAGVNPAHWYRTGKILRQGNSIDLTTSATLTLKVTGGATVTCIVKDHDTIENPTGGGAGTDSVTSFALSKCKAITTSPCPKKTKLGVVADGLPWSGVLLNGPPTTDELENVQLAITCTPLSGPATVTVFEGTLTPEVAPDRLRYTEGSGELSGPNSADMTVSGEDSLEAHSQALVTVKAATAAALAETGGEAVAYGRNIIGQLGGGFETTAGAPGGEQSPVAVTGLNEVVQIASGQGSAEKGFALALLNDGSVLAWGNNAFGALGNGTSGTEEEEELEKACVRREPLEFAEAAEIFEGVEEEEGLDEKSPVIDVSNVAGISAAGSGSVALLHDGSVWTWGINQDGEHGNKHGGPRCETHEPNGTPQAVESLHQVQAIASGSGDNFALVKQGAPEDAGDVLAWGRDIGGRLGVGGPTGKQKKQEEEKYEKELKEVEEGKRESVVEREWICRTEIGLQECSKEPRVVSHLPAEVTEGEVTAHVSAISAGTTYALALYSNGTIRAWGTNGGSQLGTGSKEGKTYEVPAKVKNIGEGAKFGPAVAISAGGGEPGHGLALLTDGKVVGWGSNAEGELGEPSGELCKGNETCDKTPREIAGLEDIVELAAGEGFTQVDNYKGEVYSLGNNKYGRLGTGSTAESSDVPTLVTGIGPVSSLDAGQHSGYAVLEGGVSAPPPLMTMTPEAEALKTSWTFNAAEPKKGIHVCYHLPKQKCPFEAKKLSEKEEEEKTYTFTGLLPGQQYVVTVNNAEKTRGILGTTLP